MLRFDDLIVFHDEDNSVKKLYVNVDSISDGVIKFWTIGGNLVTIPVSRLIKMKQSHKDDKEVGATDAE